MRDSNGIAEGYQAYALLAWLEPGEAIAGVLTALLLPPVGPGSQVSSMASSGGVNRWSGVRPLRSRSM